MKEWKRFYDTVVPIWKKGWEDTMNVQTFMEIWHCHFSWKTLYRSFWVSLFDWVFLVLFFCMCIFLFVLFFYEKRCLLAIFLYLKVFSLIYHSQKTLDYFFNISSASPLYLCKFFLLIRTVERFRTDYSCLLFQVCIQMNS